MRWLQRSAGKLTYGLTMKVKVTQSCPTLCNPMDYIVHGILQARILEWLAFPFSKGSSQPRDGTQVSHIAGGIFTSWATREAQEYWSGKPIPSPADLPNPGIEPGSPASQADSLPTELNWEKGFVIVQQTRSLQIFLWLFLNTSRSPSVYSKDFADYHFNCFPSWYINLWSLINSLLQ